MIIFLTYCSFILGSWIDSYPGNEILPNIYGRDQDEQYKTTTAGNLYVLQVTFTTINETKGKGGAIYIVTETNLLIESSNFIKCHSNGQGGAIYFKNATGRSFLKRVCSTNSYSTSERYQFCCISNKCANQCTNCFEHSSVANLQDSINHYNIHLEESGIIILKYDNISNNVCDDDSAFGCIPSINSSISYTSFENNTSTNLRIIGLWNNRKHYMSKCNVIGNKNNKGGIIIVSGSLELSDSCLIENVIPMFIFEHGDSTCTINKCTIDNIDIVQSRGSVLVNESNTPSKSFINDLDGLHYRECIFMENRKYMCPTFNIEKYKCNMNKNRAFLILAIF